VFIHPSAIGGEEIIKRLELLAMDTFSRGMVVGIKCVSLKEIMPCVARLAEYAQFSTPVVLKGGNRIGAISLHPIHHPFAPHANHIGRSYFFQFRMAGDFLA